MISENACVYEHFTCNRGTDIVLVGTRYCFTNIVQYLGHLCIRNSNKMWVAPYLRLDNSFMNNIKVVFAEI